MKRLITIAILCIMNYTLCNKLNAAAIGSWTAYTAYHDIQQIKAAGDDVFVLASNGLYQYNINDQSITTYDKVNGLNDIYITNIAWNKTVKQLIAVYEDSNIDMIDVNGNVTNIADLYNKSMTEDKTVNSITISDKYAYLATNFGVVKVNMANAEISESYILGVAVNKVGLTDRNIYVRATDNSVRTASLSSNLLDKNNWTLTSNYDSSIFNDDTSDYDKYYPLISTLTPGGPHYNYFGFLRFTGGKLYGANGMSGLINKACIQVYDGNNWTIYENDIEDRIGHGFVNLYCCDVDPSDESHVFAGGQTGLYEFKDGKFVKEYTNDNSPLKTASTVVEGDKNYVVVTGVKFDSNGHLWLTNSISPSTSLFEINNEGTWISHHDSRMMLTNNNLTYSMENMNDIMFDSRGLMWFTNNFYRAMSILNYNWRTSTGNTSDDLTVNKSFVNQDGVTLSIAAITSATEDREGNIWMGTDLGPLYISQSEIINNTGDYTFMQFKVPRNDGTNYADYLLNGVNVSAIAIDGAGRKWFGTGGNGVYLISEDNITEIHHFTAENSKLLSNNIRDIAINDKTGEVFFGTDKGLCSYVSNATESNDEMDKDNVYAYPNPVTPEYNGLITVVGLSYNADVKVTTATGYLVAEGRSNGGTFTWNGCDRNGKRVVSGVYNFITAKSDGTKGTVCKVAIVR